MTVSSTSDLRPVAAPRDLFVQRLREQWAEQLGRRLDVLVAGCLHDEPRTLGRIETLLTGVDEDLPAVRAATAARADLSRCLLGDLRSAPIRPRSFDVVQVSFLLERIHHAELVLDRLLQALRPGGLVLLRMRDRCSAYGLCERLAPRWLRRHLTGVDLPAVYEPLTSRDGIHAFCLSRGLMITDDETAASAPAPTPLGRTAVTLADRLTRGRCPATHDEITMVIRKPHNHFARLI
ncbi:methyltransferase domain-containing protein [Nonomuraea sp. SMC257]|uniref:Methyltransferase domain-containing protein n=1 Tax=Nonomuraea montanisoli TaxID=2741721 RepID=A0A7Y6M693_9ACTN|nr:methyltransferase domain-containing protein [Nonomuraea montanisoli]